MPKFSVLRVTFLVAALASLTAAVSASAAVSVAGSGEPAFTKSATNSFWFTWSFSTSTSQGYRFQVQWSKDGTADGALTYSPSLGAGPKSGTDSGLFQEHFGALQNGHNYGQCMSDQWWSAQDTGGLWISASFGANNCTNSGGRRTNSTIDLTKPQVATQVDGTAEYTNDPQMAISVAYHDDISPPWPGAGNLGAVYTVACSGGDGTSCPGSYDYSAACSNLTGPRATNTSFGCSWDASAAPDGMVTVCAVAADSAMPDNPVTSDQLSVGGTRPVNSSDANISDPSCGHVTLDRVAPSLSLDAPGSVATGALVTAAAGGTDAVSGLSGGYAWDWGDNTAPGSGQSATHTYTQPGTYTVKVTSSDKAGNPAAVSKTITVSAPPAGGGTTTQPGGGGTTTAISGGTVVAPPSNQAIVKSGGGGGSVAGGRSASLRATVAGRFRAGARRRTMIVGLVASAPGSATVSLVKGSRTRSSGRLTFTGAGRIGYRLKLPARLAPGRYVVRIGFVPKAGGRRETIRLGVTVTGARSKARASAAQGGAPRLVGSGAVDRARAVVD